MDLWKDDGHSILTNLLGNFSEIDSFYDESLEIVTAIAGIVHHSCGFSVYTVDCKSIECPMQLAFQHVEYVYMKGNLSLFSTHAVVISLAPLVSLVLCLILLVHMVASVQ